MGDVGAADGPTAAHVPSAGGAVAAGERLAGKLRRPEDGPVQAGVFLPNGPWFSLFRTYDRAVAIAGTPSSRSSEAAGAEALTAAEDLLDLLRFLPPRQGESGLIEQQRLFARARA